MDNLKYAMETSYAYMVEEINSILSSSIYSVEEGQRLFYACGTCLHWILDYAERLDITEEDKKLISAFRFANNALKHDKTLLEITEQTGGLRFPIRFPAHFTARHISWKDIEDNGKYESQYKNYVQYLKNRDVVITCREVIERLLEYEEHNNRSSD